MKTGLIIILFSLCTGVLSAQSAILPSPSLTSGIPTTLDMALGKGDIPAIEGYLSSQVELTIDDEKGTISKAEAVDRLEEFYAAHPAWGYHAISANDDRTQKSGQLTTKDGVYDVAIDLTGPVSRRLVKIMTIERVSPDSVSE